jgi:hypothetical protein
VRLFFVEKRRGRVAERAGFGARQGVGMARIGYWFRVEGHRGGGGGAEEEEEEEGIVIIACVETLVTCEEAIKAEAL